MDDSTFENDEKLEHEDLFPTENFKLTTTPNDFNVSTIISFLDSGVFKIPNFQRNYVWDINKASRIIESLLIGLPVPQMFLYEKSRNEFYVIDGQQRLMSIYFFIKGRFPKDNVRALLKQETDKKFFIDEEFLAKDEYFSNFSLRLDSKTNPQKNKFHNLKYQTLDNMDKVTLDLSTIRNMIIRPTIDSDENSQAMFEIFNRLNSGGMNLNHQEIRMSLYNCEFIQSLQKLNKNSIWRNLLNKTTPDLRLKDIETILRFYAMLLAGNQTWKPEQKEIKVEYSNSILAFLNNFANAAKFLDEDDISFLSDLWDKFMQECTEYSSSDFNFSNEENTKISITFFEATFYAICHDAYINKNIDLIVIPKGLLAALKNDEKFKQASTGKTSSKTNVTDRLNRAYELYTEYKSVD
ncbi:hypothetical protein PL75_10605 [Neisseria arctica]|uniref:GmrSD restriction endonucleases N-terminal domain-containing protein n=2 Tax=Neisseria arctica TaxID=1470200 RepID=A0A0J0YPD5_9NEIS|nr:hypothetical protein PL75_10605 [Neisseria arctica]